MGQPGTARLLWCGSRLQLLAPCPCDSLWVQSFRNSEWSKVLCVVCCAFFPNSLRQVDLQFHDFMELDVFLWLDSRTGVLKVAEMQDHHRTSIWWAAACWRGAWWCGQAKFRPYDTWSYMIPTHPSSILHWSILHHSAQVEMETWCIECGSDGEEVEGCRWEEVEGCRWGVAQQCSILT